MLGKSWAAFRQRLSFLGQTDEVESASKDGTNQRNHQIEQKKTYPSASDGSADIGVHDVNPQIDCSPLFRIPPEVRVIIWSHLLAGDSTIHIARLDSGLAGMRCCGGDLEDCMHSCCWGKYELTAPGVYHHERTGDIPGRSNRQSGMTDAATLLRTCQQAYIEARQVLYSANSFHFNSIKVFQEFSRTLTPQTFHTIRYLSFTCAVWNAIYPANYNSRPPTSSFPFNSETWEETWRIVASMENLQDLNLSLHMIQHPWDTRPEWDERLLSPIRQVKSPVRISVILEWGPKEHVEERGDTEVRVDNMTVQRRPNWSFEEGVAFRSFAPQWRIYEVSPRPRTAEGMRNWIVLPNDR